MNTIGYIKIGYAFISVLIVAYICFKHLKKNK